MPAVAKTVAPYGRWRSRLAPAAVARGARRLGTLVADGEALLWTEGRPEEKGRQVIMRAAPGKRPRDLLPAPFSARSRVHEYGGGELLAAGGRVWFVNDADQDIWELPARGEPVRLTQAPGLRFADMALDRGRQRLIAVAERATPGAPHPENLLVAIALDGPARGRVDDLIAGRDFYAAPRLSPDGTRLAFMAWDLPDMPWDSAAISVARLDAGGKAGRPQRLDGGSDGAAFQPEWAPDGRLLWVSDAPGGGLKAWDGSATETLVGNAAGDLLRPHWVFGMRSFAVGSDGQIAAVALDRGEPVLVSVPAHGTTAAAPRRLKLLRFDDPVACGDGFAAYAGAANGPTRIVTFTSGTRFADVYAPPGLALAADQVSVGRVVAFPSAGGATAYGIYYAPKNPAFRAPAGTKPPALVLAHGGPTASAARALSPRIQFYTSRGFAVLDVDYAGSTGYGRAYRQRLDGKWGLADVADCAAGARFLAAEGLADPARIAIAGGSAGGYTTLMALATTDAFAAGSSHYGISDLGLLLAHTHKFEAGYLHRLMGTTARTWKRTFAERSPLALIEGMRAPVILFQGLDDKVVPPEQSRLIADRLGGRGIATRLVELAGEGHGFRKAESIVAVLEAELAFLVEALRLDVTSPPSQHRRR